MTIEHAFVKHDITSVLFTVDTIVALRDRKQWQI